MPSTSEKVYVTMKLGSSDLKYGYQMPKITHGILNTPCGIVSYNGAAGVFFGINSPKPWRAVKHEDNGTTRSSFVSDSKLPTLRKSEEFDLIAPKGALISPTTNPNYTTVYIEVPVGGGQTVKYAWNMKKALFDLVGATLGIEAVTAGDVATLIKGINSPKLPRASKRIGGKIKETFISAKKSVIDKAVAAGWSVKLFDFESIDDTQA